MVSGEVNRPTQTTGLPVSLRTYATRSSSAPSPTKREVPISSS